MSDDDDVDDCAAGGDGVCIAMVGGDGRGDPCEGTGVAAAEHSGDGAHAATDGRHHREPDDDHAPTPLGGEGQRPPPPAPVRTQGPFSKEPPKREAEINISNRPDLSYGRGAPQDGISINESFLNTNQELRQEKSNRPEMDGPQDITELLSGLKNKTEDKQEKSGLFKKEESKEKKRRNGSAKNTISLNI